VSHRARSLAALALVALGCGERGCGVRPRRGPAPTDAGALAREGGAANGGPSPRSASEIARCRLEIEQGALAVMAGAGAFSSLRGRCDGDTLEAWVERGHTLSRSTRSARPGSAWTLTTVVASGVEGASIVSPTDGPVAWRAPTAAIEGFDSEEWWVLRRARGDERGPWARGSLGWPASVQGRGLLAAVEARDDTVTVLGSVIVSEADAEPRVVLASVRAPSGENVRLAEVPPRGLSGELRAYATDARVALVVRAQGERETRVEALSVTGDALVSRGGATIAFRNVVVAPVGVSSANEAAFLLAGFERADPSSQGGCLYVGERLCVRPGPLSLVRVSLAAGDGATATTIESIAPSGLPDALALEPDGRTYVALFVGVASGEPVQRAVRFDRASGHRDERSVRARGLPAIDHPTLLQCAGELWMLGEALVSEGEDGGARESGVVAVPFGCLGE
jgi:hypothetical protein